MIAGKQYDIVLSYYEVFMLEEYLNSIGTYLEDLTNGESYSANAYGITIRFGSEKKRDELVNIVLIATDDPEEY